jgi:GNAT superfamily N-acetyltransferase
MEKPSSAMQTARPADAALRFRIRRARPDEAEALTELTLRSKAYWDYDAAFLARCRIVMRILPGMIRDNVYCVAEAEPPRAGAPALLGVPPRAGEAALLGVPPRAGKPALLGVYGFEPEPDGVGLDVFFVEPEAIGRGVGRALWRHAVERARRLGAPALTVQSDPNAAGFYRRMGCRPAGGRASEIEPGRILPLFRFALSDPPA